VELFLPDTINTFSTNSRATVGSLIRQMKVDKTDMNSLIGRLSSFAQAANYSSARIPALSRLNSEILVDTFRDSFLKTKTMFSAANAAGLVLSSMIDVFFSDIKKIEDDLSKLESFINNYEFISGKDDLYNVNYVEKFDSLTNSYIYEDPDIRLVDRDGVNFPEGGNFFIDSDSGVLKIGSTLQKANLLGNIKSINVKDNYSSHISSSTNINNIFNENAFESWSVTAKSPTLITSQIEDIQQYIDYDYSFIRGAQTEVDIRFNSPIEIDSIKIDPNKSNGLLLLQVVVFGSDISLSASDSNVNEFTPNKILKSPRSLQRNTEISFDRVLSDRVILIFNQVNYTKTSNVPVFSEVISKGIAAYISKRLKEKRSSFSMFQDMVYWHFIKNATVKGIRRSVTAPDDYYSNRFPQQKDLSFVNQLDKALKEGNTAIEDAETYRDYNIISSYLKSVFGSITFDKNLFESNYYIESSINSGNRFNAETGPIFSYGNSNLADPIYLQFDKPLSQSIPSVANMGSFFSQEDTNQYEYSFSINSIDFCVSRQQNLRLQKACFITKKIGQESQIIGIKAKVNLNESARLGFVTENQDLDSVSYELSVCNLARPLSDSDWVPIAPYGVSEISSEVLFPDNSLKAVLRFNAKLGTVVLYKNGQYVDPSIYLYNASENSITIRVPTFISSGDILVAKYELDIQNYTQDEIDLLSIGKFKESIKTFVDASGQGEKFRSTSSERRVRLSYTPYINQEYSSTSKYSPTFGTIFQAQYSGYSPVKVLISNQTYAVNITNYSPNPSGASFYPSNTPLFIHNGKEIIFDRQISDPFTVFYDYIPADLRMRIIMRNTVPNNFSSSGIDELIIKMKTLNYDPYYDKLRKLDGSRYS
jgi:hypothetical protein